MIDCRGLQSDDLVSLQAWFSGLYIPVLLDCGETTDTREAVLGIYSFSQVKLGAFV